MAAHREIRANYDRSSIVMYQAYAERIAKPALEAQTFVEPFSFGRMTWIKPSFLWLMERSGWGRKAGQERILAVRISRSGFERALGQAVLTSFEARVHASPQAWQALFEKAKVHVQWDPERSMRGQKLPHRSIQVGLSRHVIREFVDRWIVGIDDLTELAQKIYKLRSQGRHDQARRLLPPERVYPLEAELAQRIACEPAR